MSEWIFLAFHQLFYLAHLALQESVDGNEVAVGVKSDGGEAGEGRKGIL